ncbi:hypothetical protein GCM10023217_31990 [Gordonia alkaliphila]|uniref:Uncharacterized protein n=2 Tax=Gordonia alkaliphila TaxID=1053547 RepID=A0ABP8ZIX0_9ACTN
MPRMYDLALSTNRHTRAQTWMQGAQLATMVGFAINNHRQMKNLSSSVDDLRTDLVEHNGQLLARIDSLAAQTVSEISAADRRSAHRDYAMWRSSTEDGLWFDSKYLPAARAWVDRVVSISKLWQSMVVDQVSDAVARLSPVDRECLINGFYGPAPAEPVPHPPVDRNRVKASWLIPILLALVISVGSAVVGAVTHSHSSDDQSLATAQIVRPDQEHLLPQDPDTGAALTVKRTLELYDGTGRPFVTQPTTNRPAPTFEEIREAISMRRTFDAFIGAIVGGILGVVAALLALIGARILLKRRAVTRAEQQREQAIAFDRQCYSQAMDDFYATSEREYRRITGQLSAALGFDVRSVDVLKEWGSHDYLGRAEKIAKWLQECEQELPSPRQCPALVPLQINPGWACTPMGAHASHLADDIGRLPEIRVSTSA